MQSVRHPPRPRRHPSVHPWGTSYPGRASAAAARVHARQCQLRHDDTSSEYDDGAVGAVVVVVGAADVGAAVGAAVAAVDVDVDADGDGAQRTKQRVKVKKRTMEDQAILALTAQRVDAYVKNRATVAAVVGLAGAGADGVAAVAVAVGGGDGVVVPGPMDAGGGAAAGAAAVAVVAADMQPPTLGRHTAQTASSSPLFLQVHLGMTDCYHRQKHRFHLY